jgi:hypothetical protein
MMEAYVTEIGGATLCAVTDGAGQSAVSFHTLLALVSFPELLFD